MVGCMLNKQLHSWFEHRELLGKTQVWAAQPHAAPDGLLCVPIPFRSPRGLPRPPNCGSRFCPQTWCYVPYERREQCVLGYSSHRAEVRSDIRTYVDSRQPDARAAVQFSVGHCEVASSPDAYR